MNIFHKKGILCVLFIIINLNLIAQENNRFILGLANSGFILNDNSNPDKQKSIFYIQLSPQVGFKVYDSLYVFIEFGRSFKNTKNIDNFPNLWHVGTFTRWYVHKYKILDFYTGCGIDITNIGHKLVDDSYVSYQHRGLRQVNASLFGGISIRLYKKLYMTWDIGFNYDKDLGIRPQRKLCFQLAL